MMRGKGGQMMIFSLLILVMVIIVLIVMLPVIKQQIDTVRNQDGLNCKQTDSRRLCNGSSIDPCYNASLSSETTTCLIFDIYLPYIAIAVLIGGIAMLLGRGFFGGGQSQQPMYGGYQ